MRARRGSCVRPRRYDGLLVAGLVSRVHKRSRMTRGGEPFLYTASVMRPLQPTKLLTLAGRPTAPLHWSRMKRSGWGLMLGAALALSGPELRGQHDNGLVIALRTRAFQPGEVMLVEIEAPESITHLDVRVFDSPVTAVGVQPGRWEALAGIDLDRKTGDYSVAVSAGDANGTKAFAVQPRTFPTRTLKVNPDFVNPPKSAMARIEEETKLVAHAYASGVARRLWSDPFLRPVPQEANSAFGTRSVFNGEPRSAHGGTDFLSPGGTPILAPNDGRVLVARPLYFAGGSVPDRPRCRRLLADGAHVPHRREGRAGGTSWRRARSGRRDRTRDRRAPALGGTGCRRAGRCPLAARSRRAAIGARSWGSVGAFVLILTSHF